MCSRTVNHNKMGFASAPMFCKETMSLRWHPEMNYFDICKHMMDLFNLHVFHWWRLWTLSFFIRNVLGSVVNLFNVISVSDYIRSKNKSG